MTGDYLSLELELVNLSGKMCLPIVEGGKGIGISDGTTAGNFAKCGAVGTISGVNADILDDNGEVVPLVYHAKERLARHLEMVKHSILGGISQAKRAYDICGSRGRIHLNVLWEMAASEEIMMGILDGAKGLIHGVVCGAGMPYRLAEIAARYQVYYYPIVSSMRAFRLLWKRSYSMFKDWLGAVVYECPWRAGGHNGLSNKENPLEPGDTYSRVTELRSFLNEIGLDQLPIIVAGGVWNLKEYAHYLQNRAVGPVAFQFGTRPMVTQESPISQEWKLRLLHAKPGDVYLNNYSPTGFYSSALRNAFLDSLDARMQRQFSYRTEPDAEFSYQFNYRNGQRTYYFRGVDQDRILEYLQAGYNIPAKTPDENVLVLLSEAEKVEMLKERSECVGCLSQCRFSSWNQDATKNYVTGRLPDPRTYCIQTKLMHAFHGVDLDHQLLFSGKNAFRFATDPLYNNDHIPTIAELIAVIQSGN